MVSRMQVRLCVPQGDRIQSLEELIPCAPPPVSPACPTPYSTGAAGLGSALLLLTSGKAEAEIVVSNARQVREAGRRACVARE